MSQDTCRQDRPSRVHGRGPARRDRRATGAKLGGLAILLVIAAIFPLVITDALYTQFAVNTMIYVGTVAAWNLFSGYSGYLSLGTAVFFGSGAYTVGLLANRWKLPGADIFLLLPLGGLVAALIAVPLGLIALRVRRHTFVVITSPSSSSSS